MNYISENRNKKVVFKTFISNQYNNQTTSGGNFNALVNSGILHPTGILLIPYISSAVSTALGDYAKFTSNFTKFTSNFSFIR
jgi:hypothetical protein